MGDMKDLIDYMPISVQHNRSLFASVQKIISCQLKQSDQIWNQRSFFLGK
jgi:hypothetical protein